MSWASDAAGVTGFRVERSLSTTGGWAQVALLGGNVSSLIDTGLTGGTTYYYRVRSQVTAACASCAFCRSSKRVRSPYWVPITSFRLLRLS